MEEPRYEEVPVHVYAKRENVTCKTVRNWIRDGKVAARKTPGGQSWRVQIPVKKKT